MRRSTVLSISFQLVFLDSSFVKAKVGEKEQQSLCFNPSFFVFFSAVGLPWRMWRRMPSDLSRPPPSMPMRCASGPLNKSIAEVIFVYSLFLKLINFCLQSFFINSSVSNSVCLGLSNFNIQLGILWSGTPWKWNEFQIWSLKNNLCLTHKG